MLYSKMTGDVAENNVSLKDRLNVVLDEIWPSKELVEKYKSKFNFADNFRKSEDVQLTKQDYKLWNPEEKFITENK